MVRIVRHPAAVSCVAWAGDATRLCSGCADGRLRLIDGDSDSVVAERPVGGGRATAVAAFESGFLAGTTAGDVAVWRQP
jgi:hypothetical protein